MSAFSDYLRGMNTQVPPSPSFAGILTDGTGPPDANTSPFFFFYEDTETGDIYFTPNRDGTWEIALAGSYLDTDEARLKVEL
jgi:hypothetical protein